MTLKFGSGVTLRNCYHSIACLGYTVSHSNHKNIYLPHLAKLARCTKSYTKYTNVKKGKL